MSVYLGLMPWIWICNCPRTSAKYSYVQIFTVFIGHPCQLGNNLDNKANALVVVSCNEFNIIFDRLSPSSSINTVGKWSSIWNFSLKLLGMLFDINSCNGNNLLSFYSQVINSLIQLWHTASSSSPLFNISASFVVVSHLQYALQTYLRSLHHGTFSMNQGLLHLY